MIKNRNLFRLSRFVIFNFPKLLRILSKFCTPKKRVLLIKTDAIGDYILFRNFIEVVKKSDQFKDYEIDLLGNELWKDVALEYDTASISEFIFVRPNALLEAPLQIFKLGWGLFRKNYHTVLQPTYSRTLIADGLAAFTAAKEIIGFESDYEGILKKYKKRTDKFYTAKLMLPPDVYFEFDRTKYFFENILNQNIDLKGPKLDIAESERSGIMIFPGAGSIKRSWSVQNFMALTRLIMDDTSHQIYAAGGPSEQAAGDYLTENLPPERFTNLIGKTSLPELIRHIASSALIISNDSSAIHIAAATGTPSVCILGGGHYERFAPYPSHIENGPVCVYYKMPCYYCNWICKFETLGDEPFPCIANVELAEVWRATKGLLTHINNDQ